MKNKFLISILLLLCSAQSFAKQCWNAKGKNVVEAVTYDLKKAYLNSGENNVGQTKELKFDFKNPLQAICDVPNTPYNYTNRAYETGEPIVETDGSHQYMRINDYLLGAIRITDSSAGTFYPPARVQMGSHPNVSIAQPFPVADSNITLRLKVIKPFIGSVSIPSKQIFKVYVMTYPSDKPTYPIYTIGYFGEIIAPQSCKINSGTVLDIKFGDILASEFSQAGIGNKPKSVDPETRSVSVQCSNMNAAATVSFRIESETSQGDMVTSKDNADVGFKISDTNGKILIPNNLSSYSEFLLDQSQHATISFKAWPVSVTGKKPALGKFTSRAYIRIDFQ